MSSAEELVVRLGRIHNTVHGDGVATLERVVTTCFQMLVDRAHSNVRRAPSALDAIEQGRPVVEADGAEVYVSPEDRVSVKALRQLVERSPDGEKVVVSTGGPTPFARKEMRSIQFFSARELYVNLTRHSLVPAHERVDSPPDGVEVANLPLMLPTDPLVRYYAWPAHTVVRFERTFHGHEPTTYYRAVGGVVQDEGE